MRLEHNLLPSYVGCRRHDPPAEATHHTTPFCACMIYVIVRKHVSTLRPCRYVMSALREVNDPAVLEAGPYEGRTVRTSLPLLR